MAVAEGGRGSLGRGRLLGGGRLLGRSPEGVLCLGVVKRRKQILPTFPCQRQTSISQVFAHADPVNPEALVVLPYSPNPDWNSRSGGLNDLAVSDIHRNVSQSAPADQIPGFSWDIGVRVPRAN